MQSGPVALDIQISQQFLNFSGRTKRITKFIVGKRESFRDPQP